MRRILLKFDEAFFYKMKEDKVKREKKIGENLTWEKYINLLLGLSDNGRKN